MDNYIVRTTEDLLSDDICGEVFFDCTEKIIPAILDRAMRRITDFSVSEENPYYTSYEGILYSKDGKKVILAQSILSDSDIKEFEYEANIKVFFVMPPLDERSKNTEVLQDLLARLGISNY